MNISVLVILFQLQLQHIQELVHCQFYILVLLNKRQKYIPKLITGEWAGAYGLTEPNSGSDALVQKQPQNLVMMENIICSMDKNAGSPMEVLQMCIPYLQKLMAINSRALL